MTYDPCPAIRPRSFRFHSACAATCVAALLLSPGRSLADTEESPAATNAAEPSSTAHPSATPAENVIVTAKRLPDGEASRQDVPAHVTVITRERIEKSGARTVQELLSREAGVVVYDQVGNDVQTTLDLRGFASGSGTAVFVDGARINDPRNNSVSLELVPIDSVERIEVTRGSAAALAGGGSEAGVIQIWTRRGDELAAGLSAAYGRYGTVEASGSVGGSSGPLNFLVSGAYDKTDGFRENADGDQKRFSATVGFELSAERRVDVSLASSDLDYGNPGALTVGEAGTNPSDSPFNSLDRTNDSLRQASVNYRGALPAGWSVAANLFYRDRESEVLTTGRAAPLFGGFFLSSDGSTQGSTAQLSHDGTWGSSKHQLAIGAEWWGGDTRSRGYFTPPDDPGSFDRGAPDSDNKTTRSAAALFAQDMWKPVERWGLMLGARYDRDRTRYDESIPDPALAGARTFSELSLRVGTTVQLSDPLGAYLSYGEGFLAPTAEQLFAFPGFGSNAELQPEDSRSFEVGLRADVAKTHLDLALFRVDTQDEIVFDPTPLLPDDPFGRNVNAGETRRRGGELSARGKLTSRLEAFANVTIVDADFQSGPEHGKRVPLVPRQRYAAGLELGLPAGLSLGADLLYVGSQVLDNDDANTQDELAPYAVVDMRLRWKIHGPDGAKGITAFVEGKNVLDREYSTRGIYAFDFTIFENAVFVTPAPGRRWLAGIAWKL